MPNTNRYIATILGIAAALGAVCTVVAFVKFDAASGLSVAVGTALGMGNVYALAKLVTMILDGEVTAKRRTRAAILLGAKFLALITVVGVLIVNHWVRGGALMAGLSMVALAIVIGGLVRSDDDSTSPRSLS
jgi:hypothetical protein